MSRSSLSLCSERSRPRDRQRSAVAAVLRSRRQNAPSCRSSSERHVQFEIALGRPTRRSPTGDAVWNILCLSAGAIDSKPVLNALDKAAFNPQLSVVVPCKTCSGFRAARSGWALTVYPEEAPVHMVTVSGFWMGARTVTNAEFADFCSGHRLSHPGRTLARPGALSGCPARPAQTRLGGVLYADRQGGHARPRTADGPMCPAPIGAVPMGPPARSKDASRNRWCMWRLRMRLRMPPGRGRNCQPKPSGNLPHAADWMARHSAGVMSSRPAAVTWRTPGKATFPFRMLGPDGFVSRAPVGSFPPNGYGLYDMAGMSGNGRQTGIPPGIRLRPSRRAACRAIREAAPRR